MFNFYTLPLCNPIIVLIVALQIEIIVTHLCLAAKCSVLSAGLYQPVCVSCNVRPHDV